MQPNYIGSNIRKENTQPYQERGKRLQEIYRVRDIEKGINGDPLRCRFKKTKLEIRTHLLAIIETSRDLLMCA